MTGQLPHTVASFAKNSAESVRVSLDEFKGVRLVDARVFAAYTAGDDPRPTKKGLSVRVDLLPDLICALNEAHRQASARGWVSE